MGQALTRIGRQKKSGEAGRGRCSKRAGNRRASGECKEFSWPSCCFPAAQDSTTCLAWALSVSSASRPSASTMASATRRTGARHARARRSSRIVPRWAAPAGRGPCSGPPRVRRDLRHGADQRQGNRDDRQAACPTHSCPGRNLIFLAFAAALAYRRGLTRIVARHVRDRFFRLSRLPRRHDQGPADRAEHRHGEPLRAGDAADVDRQGARPGRWRESWAARRW